MSKIRISTMIVFVLPVANAWGAVFMDDFNRPDGELGNDWATVTDGQLRPKL